MTDESLEIKRINEHEITIAGSRVVATASTEQTIRDMDVAAQRRLLEILGKSRQG